ncbi:hypothetical protein E4665_01495 [Sporolactobacillus shoreae]|uniref:Uncharacterized protein n=1 Tax=Sporolactobacillus shoreae TaxID=1465501 RepID=A0A4Z0GT25_9BACL|nr:hypothetical protein [Sporolactobacillus shoreae]TGB00379.1 hypothetical protein E4665_01495 [Sporolactobacillus shoreae]
MKAKFFLPIIITLLFFSVISISPANAEKINAPIKSTKAMQQIQLNAFEKKPNIELIHNKDLLIGTPM